MHSCMPLKKSCENKNASLRAEIYQGYIHEGLAAVQELKEYRTYNDGETGRGRKICMHALKYIFQRTGAG